MPVFRKRQYLLVIYLYTSVTWLQHTPFDISPTVKVDSFTGFNTRLMLKRYLCFQVNKKDFTMKMMTVSVRRLFL